MSVYYEPLVTYVCVPNACVSTGVVRHSTSESCSVFLYMYGISAMATFYFYNMYSMWCGECWSTCVKCAHCSV